MYKPYIKSLDRNTIIGELVYVYGEEQWYNGYMYGFISGALLCTTFYVVLRK